MGTYASSAIYIAWKKGQAIKPFAAFASRQFSPEKRPRIRPRKVAFPPTRLQPFLRGRATVYIAGFYSFDPMATEPSFPPGQRIVRQWRRPGFGSVLPFEPKTWVLRLAWPSR